MSQHGRDNGAGRTARTQIARQVFRLCEAHGISDRGRVERIAEQVIARLEQTQPFLPGMEGTALETRPSAHAVEEMVKQIIGEGGHMEVTVKPAEPRHKGGRAVARRVAAGGGPPQLSENAMRVLERRYLKRDDQGRPAESPHDMFRRVARDIASAEQGYDPGADVAAWEEEFLRAMVDLDFLPNSPTLMNAGRELQQLSACFVLPIEDNTVSIFDAVKYTAIIHKSGGGTGFSFSRLRPENDRVGSTGGVASGPVSFMRAFDAATDVIKQGGMRRGANMAILNVDHPDIMQFICAKEQGDCLTNFNLSVAVSDAFMAAVEQGADYDLVNPHSGEVAGQLNARAVFDAIVDMAWRTGDPGIVFIDRINQHNPTPALGRIESTNPCGEQPLLPYESCNLGSINLAHMVHDEGEGPTIDRQRLGRAIATAVRFLDDVIDRNQFPLPQIAEMTRKTRKIGLGVMGFADMLIKLGVPYDSEEGLRVAEEVMRFVSEQATAASVALAEERGVFPTFEGSIYDHPGGPRVRNANITTIAPTGTLSIIAGCSSGIEPLFALSYTRNILDGDGLIELNELFEEAARREGFYSDELMREVAAQGSLHDVAGCPERVQRLFVTSHDINPQWHVRMQSAFQQYTDSAVSKTVNFPHSATREDVAQVYMLAYHEGCKGITIYRDRSKEHQVLSIEGTKGTEEVTERAPRRRPRRTSGFTERVATGCGNIYVTVNYDEDGVCEVFSSLGKAGGCASAQLEAISRLISLALRSGVSVESVAKHLKGIRCPSMAWEEGHAVLSCPDAIGSVLERCIGGEGGEPRPVGPHSYGELPGDDDFATEQGRFGATAVGHCPDCGGTLWYQEGCYICRGCGYTKCS